MKNNKTFSLIIINDNEENLENCLIKITQQLYELDQIEIIIETLKLDNKYLEEIKKINLNSVIREHEILNISECYNDAIKICSGEIISFMNSNILLEDKNTLKKVINYLKNYNIVSCNIYYKDMQNNSKYIFNSNIDSLINVEAKSGNINPCIESYFINKNILKDITFDKDFNDEATYKFILSLYEISKEYFALNSVTLVSCKPLDTDPIQFKLQFNNEWYNNSLSNWLNYIKSLNRIPLYIQEMIMYLIYIKYNCNYNDRNKAIIKDKELENFINITKEILLYIDDTIILQTKIDCEYKTIKHKFKIPRPLKFYFYKLKNKKIDNYVSNSTLYDTSNHRNIPIIKFSNEKIEVHAINYKDNILYFDCAVTLNEYIDEKDFKIQIMYGDKLLEVRRNYIYSKTKVFDEDINEKYTFCFEINIDNNYNDIRAICEYNNTKYLLNFSYIKPQSRLSDSKRSYWNFKDFILENKINYITIRKSSAFKIFKLETLFLLSKLKNEKDKIRVIKLSILRVLYYLTKPFMKNKHIWITFDKLYKAGDNGEYIYQYGINNNKNIYYIINKDSPDYARLKSQKNNHILIFNSLKQKLYCLHSEVLLKTHANILGFCGFDGLARIFIRGLFNPEIIEIQHGLTIQDIPQYQNRLVDNIKMYFIASKFERKNIIKKEYDFDENCIKLTGLPRYDGLKNNDKNIILITPTWRHSLASSSTKHGSPRGHNDEFIKSDYYKIYNSLINNEKLIKSAEKNNYKIVYLIHPTLSGQIDDFEKNDFVDIIPATGEISYEKILTESSLMVTDYSGVQYDFAYMRKPIIYFLPDELPPHYGSSIDYESDGFGPIIKNIENLVEFICKKMDNNCQNDEKYIKRANNFFEYNDYNNCKRIMDNIDIYLKEINK